jgi:hypothetical protein
VLCREQLARPIITAAKETGKYRLYDFYCIIILTRVDLFDDKEIRMQGGAAQTAFKQSVKDKRPAQNSPELF